MIEFTVTLHAAPGTFQPTSMTEWIGHLVDVTGLDPNYQHVLQAVENTETGDRCTLTIHTHPDTGTDLTADMSVRWGTPTAEVRAHVDGQHVTTAHLEAPLQPGQTVRIGDQAHTVLDVHYPNRSDDGTTTGDDYQHANLRPLPDKPPVASLGPAAGILGMLG